MLSSSGDRFGRAVSDLAVRSIITSPAALSGSALLAEAWEPSMTSIVLSVEAGVESWMAGFHL
jgi:hypothetical protein